jgi:hypothetical protein
MMPTWFPWIFVGGLVFVALSFTAAKYKSKDYKKLQGLQDFISGTILIAFTGVLMPDVFPKLDLPESIGTSFKIDDFDIQVGPPRLAGH